MNRPNALRTVRRLIVRAAPTCTLWRHSMHEAGFVFRFNKRWKISDADLFDLEDGRF